MKPAIGDLESALSSASEVCGKATAADDSGEFCMRAKNESGRN